MESMTACGNKRLGSPSSVSTARIAFELTDATFACVWKKLSHRLLLEPSGTLTFMMSPTAGTEADTWLLRLIEKREPPPSWLPRDRRDRRDRSNERTLLSIACCGVLAKGTSPSWTL